VGLIRQCGSNLFIFGAVVFAWHAMRYSGDLRDKQLRSAELESLLREARLQALRSQLNPHFLFNTLHSIAELVHENPPLAEQLILRLGELLRKVLASVDQQEVALSEELDFIRAYLDIEQMRLGERLTVEWDIDQETKAVKVPTLLLQPLVENAVQHGIAASNIPGTVRIQARRENGFLQLLVQDSGPGFDQSNPRTNPGIGLKNTEARLRTIFGDNHRFELINDRGLLVRVRLPITVPTASANVTGN
jgi:sensor histidine kinase YesM